MQYLVDLLVIIGVTITVLWGEPFLQDVTQNKIIRGIIGNFEEIVSNKISIKSF